MNYSNLRPVYKPDGGPVRSFTLNRGLVTGLMASALSFASAASFAEEIDLQAMAWASACVTCHGAAQPVAGSSVASLAGMDATELVSKMQAFAAGDMPGSLMQQLARGYDADVLTRIAQWYEQQGKETP